MNNYDDIVVSVLMLSYNHEDTIARAIEGVIHQKTKYRYELLIGDDASTDHSQMVIMKYAERYPDKIVPICREENLGANKNSQDLIKRSKGAYIAVCEGDDYWIDNNKLEMQVSYLEKHHEYSASYTRCKMMVDGKETSYPFCDSDSESKEDMLNGGDIKRYPTCTLVYRNIFADNSELLHYFDEGGIGDIIIQALLIEFGKVNFIDEETAVYDKGVTLGNSFSSNSIEHQLDSIKKAINVCRHISGTKYENLWNEYLVGFIVAAFWEKKENNIFKAILWLLGLEHKERKALVFRLKKDYLQIKNRKRCKN